MVFSGDEVKASNAEAVGMALHSAFIELDDQILKRAVVRLRTYSLPRPCFGLLGCVTYARAWPGTCMNSSSAAVLTALLDLPVFDSLQ